MFKRTGFQNGSLKKEPRKLGPDVWTYRWREIGPDGQIRKPKVIIGTVADLPTLSLAKRAVAALGLGINSSTPQAVEEITMGQLMAHYTTKELSEERVSKTPYTCDVYRGYFKTWILPRWGTYRLGAVKTSEVESWLRSIQRADGTKVKIRNLMATLFNHAIRWEFAKSNPITGPSRGSGVRQSGKRASTPERLTIEEIRSILNELSDRLRTLVFLIACTGLRFSELRGLKWMDLNLASLSLEIRRGVVKGYLGDLKTRASHRVMPLHQDLAALLEQLREVSPHNKPTDWIFASTIKNGSVPIWPTSLMVDHIQPAAVRAGVDKHVSWKMFRTSIATQLISNGENAKTAQQTLGHANSQITTDVYAQSVPCEVRSAHYKLVDMVIAAKTPAKSDFALIGPKWPQIFEGQAVSC